MGGWEIDPIGLQISLNQLYDQCKKPLFVVGNDFGACDRVEEGSLINDGYRIDYLREHIKGMRAVTDSVELMGYTWGCIDLVSASAGEMSKHYGFIYVDKHDDGSGNLERKKKKSFFWYKMLLKQMAMSFKSVFDNIFRATKVALFVF